MGAHAVNRSAGRMIFEPRAMCEVNRMCRQALAKTWDGAQIVPDILDVLPAKLRAQLNSADLSPENGIRLVVNWREDRLALPAALETLRSDVLVAGIPCVDFSLMGKRQRLGGPSFILILAWAFAVRQLLPLFVVIENVVQFPSDLLHSLVGDLFTISEAEICPSALGWPIKRRRKYFLLCRSGAARVTRPFVEWRGLTGAPDDVLDGQDLFLPDSLVSWDPTVYSQQKLGAGYRKNLAAYHRLGHKRNYRGYFDLSQSADKRPRVSKESDPCMTLTTNSTHLFSPAARRCLSGVELLLGQGFVASTTLGDALSAPMHAGLGSASRSAAARWAGNAMHVGAVGSVLLWIAAYGERLTPEPSTSRSGTGTSQASPSCSPCSTPCPPSTSRSEAKTSPAPRACPPPDIGTDPNSETIFSLIKCLTDHQPAGERNQAGEHKPRSRDLFPLPELHGEHLDAMLLEVSVPDKSRFLSWCTLVILGLNRLAGCTVPPYGSRINSAQLAVLFRLSHKVKRTIQRLSAVSVPSGRLCLAELIGDTEVLGRSINPPLVAADCDLLDRSGLVDPMPDLSSSARGILDVPEVLFERISDKLRVVPRIRRSDLAEYCKLVGMQLRSRKVALSTVAFCGAGVFAVGKKNGRSREVWNGHDLSEASAKPPLPPLLASPTALTNIEIKPGTRVFVSKRDMKAYFDQLSLADNLRPYFARPPLRLRDLLRHGDISEEELFELDPNLAICDMSTLLYPLCTTWPMGYAWSSFIAQTVLLRRCEESGLDRSIVLADTAPLPTNFDTCFALATDDLMLFSVAPEDAVDPSLSRRIAFDNVIARHGLIPATEKDVNDELSATCIGIDVDAGRYLAPHASKAAMLVEAIGHLYSGHVHLSDLELAALLGQCTWFGIMNRPSLGAFDEIYGITKANGSARQEIPSGVVQELVHFVSLLPLLEADLMRPWQKCILATDASIDFGFGVSIADAPSHVVRELARVAAAPGHYVRLERLGTERARLPVAHPDRGLREHPDDEPERPRKGIGHVIGLSKWDFRSVISARRQFDAHSGALEAHGVSLGLRWLLRSTGRHARRTTILIDAQSVLGAVRKGRSSAPSLKRELRFIGALILGGDLLVRCLYVPSEDNPADAPSRGVVRKHVFNKHRRRKGQPRHETALERHIRNHKPFLDKIDALDRDHPIKVELARLQD